MKLISKLIYWIYGWKLINEFPKEVKKCVLAGGPHTSNWDMIFGRAFLYLANMNVKFLVKKEAVNTWYGWMIKGVGGIPVDRSKSNNTVEAMAKVFDDYDELQIGVSVEGTRKHVEKWKSGFYYIALEAKIPIVIAFLDYDKKEAGFGPVIYPSGDYEKDVEKMKVFWRTKKGRYPKLGIQ